MNGALPEQPQPPSSSFTLSPSSTSRLPTAIRMASTSVLILISLTLLLLQATPSASQPTGRVPRPTARDHNATDDFLPPHNEARQAVSVPPLSWSVNLTRSASLLARLQRNNSRCGFADLSSSFYGANQAVANYHISPAEVVASWVAEGRWYSYSANACAAGHECGTYTQVVWRSSKEVGCAQAVCPEGDTISICLYWPHGNVQGQKPY